MPDVDDGCDLTTDSFDTDNCVIVNQAPDCDDGNDCTIDSFNETLCICEYETACGSISGTAFVDNNGNNLFDDGSDGFLPDMMVLLVDATNDEIVDTVFTDANGAYLFTEIAVGSYYVVFELPSTPVIPNMGINDSDINANGETEVIVVGVGATMSGTNAGFVPLNSIECNDFIALSSVVCADDNATYSLIISVSGGSPEDGGYLITDNTTGFSTVIFNNTILVTILAGNGYDYTVSVVNHPLCSENLSETLVDCSVTAVELLNFEGEVKDEGNMLYWQTVG